jgi:hypothetical protein
MGREMSFKKLSPRFYGLSTLLLLLGSLLVGLVAIALKSALAAVLYALMIAAGLPVIVYLFCGKCACRGEACLMVWPGRLSLRLPPRKTESYTRWDFAGILGTLVLLGTFPVYWLFQTLPLLVVFFVLMLGAHAAVMLSVCPACENCRCPVHRRFHRNRGT